MGNATKVALVALLILMVVVVARFVREDTAVPDPGDAARAAAAKPAAGKTAPESIARKTALNPAATRIPAASRTTGSPSRPGEGAGVQPRGTASGAPSPSPQAGVTANPPAPAVASGTATASGTPSAGTVTSGAVPSGSAGAALDASGRPPALPHSSDGSRLGGAPPKDDRAVVALVAPPAPGSLQGGPGRPPGDTAEARGTQPSGTAPLVQSQLGSRESHGELSGGVSSKPSDLAPSSARDRGDAAGRPSYGDVARGPARSGDPSAEPSGPQAAPTPGASGYPKSHVIAKGDTYWGLAQKYYGDGSLSALIQKENPGIKMQPGRKLSIPEPPDSPRTTAAERAPRGEGAGEAAPRRAADVPAASAPLAATVNKDYYVVQRGDTLGRIAQRFYGDAGKTNILEDANPGLKYQTLQTGARIKVPPKD